MKTLIEEAREAQMAHEDIDLQLEKLAAGHHCWYAAYHHIAAFALPLVKRIRAEHTSVPGVFVPKVSYSSSAEAKEEAYAAGLARYHQVLDDIIFSLQIVVDDMVDECEEEVKKGLELFGKYFLCLWD